jgi:hypothetical protein
MSPSPLAPRTHEQSLCGLNAPDIELFDRNHAFLAFARNERGKGWLKAQGYPEIVHAGYAIVSRRLVGFIVVEAAQQGRLSICVHPESASPIST